MAISKALLTFDAANALSIVNEFNDDLLTYADRLGRLDGHLWHASHLCVPCILYGRPAITRRISLLEKPSVTQDQNMYGTENSVIHMERSKISVIHVDRAAESIWMTEFSVTFMF
jgi:hypothetical protein